MLAQNPVRIRPSDSSFSWFQGERRRNWSEIIQMSQFGWNARFFIFRIRRFIWRMIPKLYVLYVWTFFIYTYEQVGTNICYMIMEKF